jgi:Ala-tRNA(Pro) deacylase
MRIASVLKRYLDAKGIDYEVVAHPHASSSQRVAAASGISGDRLAKAVVTEDCAHYIVVVVPASRRVHLAAVRAALGRQCGLATEREIEKLFGSDCVPGAVPAVAQPYGIEVLVDDRLLELDDVYFESGDHEALLHVSGADFRALMDNARHGKFAEERAVQAH